MEISEQHLAVKVKQYDEAYQRSLAVLSDFFKALKSFKENPKRDPVLFLFYALERLYEVGMTSARLQKLLRGFLDLNYPSEQSEHQTLRYHASVSMKYMDPHMSFLAGTTAMVLNDRSLAHGSTYKSAFYRQNLERDNEIKSTKQPHLSAPPEVFTRAVKLLDAIRCLFRAHTTRNAHANVFEENGKLHFTKSLLSPDGEFLWTAFPFANVVTNRDMEAISSTDDCRDSLTHWAPIIRFVLKGTLSNDLLFSGSLADIV